MANIKQQKKRVRIQARERLEAAAASGDADQVGAEHTELVRMIDRATSRGALHRNTAARKKSHAAKIAAGAPS